MDPPPKEGSVKKQKQQSRKPPRFMMLNVIFPKMLVNSFNVYNDKTEDLQLLSGHKLFL